MRILNHFAPKSWLFEIDTCTLMRRDLEVYASTVTTKKMGIKARRSRDLVAIIVPSNAWWYVLATSFIISTTFLECQVHPDGLKTTIIGAKVNLFFI